MIAEKKDCCGCMACYHKCSSHAIKIITDDKGFRYPSINKELCLGCGLCEKVCPILKRDRNEYQTPLQTKAVRLKDEETLKYSASGGAFYALAEYVIKNKGVVYGASYDSVMKVRHIGVCSIGDIRKLQGSKYSESDLGETYPEIKQLLNDNRLVLFSGTPCQVEGLKSFLIRQYDNLYTCDIICHCISTSMLFDDFITFVHKKYKKTLVDYRTRDKSMGWGVLSPRFVFSDGTESLASKECLLWFSFYSSQLITRPSCTNCRFANVNRPGDITVGDFWGIEKKYAHFYDKRGVSLMLLNSEKGVKLFEQTKGKYESLEVLLEDSLQPNLCASVREASNTERFWRDYHSRGFEYVSWKYFRYGSKLMLALRKFLLLTHILKIE